MGFFAGGSWHEKYFWPWSADLYPEFSLSDDKLLEYIGGQSDMQACAEGLGQLALDSGSRDNVSAVMIEVIEA